MADPFARGANGGQGQVQQPQQLMGGNLSMDMQRRSAESVRSQDPSADGAYAAGHVKGVTSQPQPVQCSSATTDFLPHSIATSSAVVLAAPLGLHQQLAIAEVQRRRATAAPTAYSHTVVTQFIAPEVKDSRKRPVASLDQPIHKQECGAASGENSGKRALIGTATGDDTADEGGNSVAASVKRNKRSTQSIMSCNGDKSASSLCEMSCGEGSSSSGGSATGAPPEDKRMRREIANSNERRRMQCINNGFTGLQNILPKNYMKRGEKMSKAAILQSTVDYITKLAGDNQKLQSKNDALTQKLSSARLDSGGESNDEGISVAEDSRAELVSMAAHWRRKFDEEHYLRMQAYEDLRRLAGQLEYCPAGCAQRLSLSAAPVSMVQLRTDKCPSPRSEQTADGLQLPMAVPLEDYLMAVKSVNMPLAMPLMVSASDMNKASQSPMAAAEAYSPFAEPVASAACASGNTVPGTPETDGAGPSGGEGARRKSSLRCPCGSASCNVLVCMQAERDAAAAERRAQLTGFDLLFEAITYSELNSQWDCGRSDSGCSEETVRSSEPPKKRPRSSQGAEQRQA